MGELYKLGQPNAACRRLFSENFSRLRIDSPHPATTADAGHGFVVFIAVGVAVLLACTTTAGGSIGAIGRRRRRMCGYSCDAEHGTLERPLEIRRVVLVAVLVVVRSLQVTCVAQRGWPGALRWKKWESLI